MPQTTKGFSNSTSSGGSKSKHPAVGASLKKPPGMGLSTVSNPYAYSNPNPPQLAGSSLPSGYGTGGGGGGSPSLGSQAATYGSGGNYGSGSGYGGFSTAASGGGGGGGGAGGAVGGGGAPAVATDIAAPFTGFASRYMPGSAEMLFANPEIILRDTLRDMPVHADGGLYHMMQPQAQAANALFALGYGGSSDLGAGSNEAGINFINDYLQNQATVGGEAINFNQGMAALNNYAPESALDSLLNLADPEEQINNYRNIASALANSSLHPLMARAFNSFLNDRGTDYMSSVARGGASSNFGNYLASRQGPTQVQRPPT